MAGGAAAMLSAVGATAPRPAAGTAVPVAATWPAAGVATARGHKPALATARVRNRIHECSGVLIACLIASSPARTVGTPASRCAGDPRSSLPRAECRAQDEGIL